MRKGCTVTTEEKIKFAKEMSWILAQKDIEKIMLNLNELLEFAICQGSEEEAHILKGLCDRPVRVEGLRNNVKYDHGITGESIIQAAYSVIESKEVLWI